MVRDSNPRTSCPVSGFQDRRIRPLCQPSGTVTAFIIYYFFDNANVKCAISIFYDIIYKTMTLDFEITLWAILILAFLLWMAFGAPLRGDIGEGTVARRLKSLPGNKYTVFNDVMVKTGRGSVQIDHIVVSQYGIFVIETKNIAGIITGTEHSENWTKVDNGRKYEFFNPITQNMGHINALAHKLNVPTSKFISIIAFSTRGRLMFHQLPTPVVYIPQVTGKIKCYRDVKLSVRRANEIADQIQKIKKYKLVSNRQHIRDVETAIAMRGRKIAAGICPSCGGRLTLRRGGYGEFWGCSNYPKCKYTRHK